MNKRKLGYYYELKAEQYLINQGYSTVAKNFYSSYGEIDLIMEKDDFIIAVEVKYRNRPEVSIFESIPKSKINKIVKGLLYYVGKNFTYSTKSLRVDAVLISDIDNKEDIVWLENIQAEY